MSADESRAINVAVLTISDTRTDVTDKSGRFLVESLQESGYLLAEKAIVPDDIYQIRAKASNWIANPEIQAIIVTGGTGLTQRDVTPEAVSPLLDREIPGFGELFRLLSYGEIGTAALQSRALAGTANGTYIFCLPGSTGACRTAWEKILKGWLDGSGGTCNLTELLPRL